MVGHRDQRRERATSFVEVAGPYERCCAGYPVTPPRRGRQGVREVLHRLATE